MPHKETRRERTKVVALKFALPKNLGKKIKSLSKDGDVYHGACEDGTRFVVKDILFDPSKSTLHYEVKMLFETKIPKEHVAYVPPKETFFGLGNPFNIIPDIIGGALGFLQTCGQKGIEASIGVAAGFFDISSGIVSALEDHIDSALDSLFSGDDSLEILLICCDLWDSVERCCQIPWTEE